MAYPFEEVEGKPIGAIALEAGQALAVAAAAVSQGQVSLAQCLLQGSAGAVLIAACAVTNSHCTSELKDSVFTILQPMSRKV